MKKLYFILLIIAATLTASCQKDAIEIPVDPEEEQGLDQIAINIVNEEESRVSVGEDGLSINWKTGDQVKFIKLLGSDLTIPSATPSIYTIASGVGTKSGIFGFTSGEKIIPESHYYLMYHGNVIPSLYSNRDVRFTLPTVQTQASGTDFSHIEQGLFYHNTNMYIENADYSTFRLAQSVLELNLSATTAPSSKLSKVTVKAPTNCFVSIFAIQTTTTSIGGAYGSTNQVTLNFTDKPLLPATARMLIYWNTNFTAAQGTITVTAELENGDILTGTFEQGKPWTAGKRYKKSLTLAPAPTGSYQDAEFKELQTHSIGAGVPLVIMGDGYTAAHMAKGTGKYETDMRAAMENFFSCYPLSTLREYFDVYMVAAISTDEGMSVISPASTKNTAFKTKWDGSGSTRITCDQTAVFDYIRRGGIVSSTVTNTQMPNYPINVIMPINYNTYAGTCTFWVHKYAMSIGMIPVNTNAVGTGRSFKETLVHECGGHGFAKVSDEYIYYASSTLPTATASNVTAYKGMGCFDNVDLNSAAASTSWGKFVTNYAAKYPMVSTYEGAMMYGKGIYRPEINSCMNNNVLYFNAPTRYAQVRNVMEISQVDSEFTIDDFVAWETTVPTPAAQPMRSSPEQFQPLAEPIVLDLPQDAAPTAGPKRLK